jgi:hypothetical protein
VRAARPPTCVARRVSRSQLLFSPDQVGESKAFACKASVERSHAIRTTASAIHADAVRCWGAVVKEALSQRISAVFNGCDYGVFFDYALQSLARSLSPPATYTAAATYAYTFQCENYGVSNKKPCVACSTLPTHPLAVTDFPSAARVTRDDVLAVLRAVYLSEHPLLEGMVSEAMHGVDGFEEATKSIPLSAGSIAQLRASLTARILDALEPGRVQSLDSIAFIPADPKPETKSVGSWVVVCCVGSMWAVSCWVQLLVGRPVPTMTIGNLNADDSPSWQEQMHWDVFKFHAEGTDGCPLCHFAKPEPEPEPEPLDPTVPRWASIVVIGVFVLCGMSCN